MKRRRNPAWLAGTNPPYAVQLRLSPGLAPRRGRKWEERREEKLQEVIGVGRFVSGEFDIETEKAARERRKAGIRAEGRIEEDAAREIERERGKPERKPRARPAPKPVNIVTAIRRLGGIARWSWESTYPGETTPEFRRALPGVFRTKRGVGRSYEQIAESLSQEGYGPPMPRDGGAVDHSWLVDAITDAQAGVQQYRTQDAGYLMQRERKALEKEQRAYEREQRRAEQVQNKLLAGVNVRGFKKQPKSFDDWRGVYAQAVRAMLERLGDKPPFEMSAREWIERMQKHERKTRAWFTVARKQLEAIEYSDQQRRRRTNPRLLIVGNPTRTAHAAFRKFHGTEPSKVRRIDGDDDLVALGDIVEVIYRPRTGVRTDADYVHKFNPGAILAATVDGTALHVIPNPRKPFHVDWSRGIIG